MFTTVGVVYVLLKHRDATVKLPVDRDQLQRIPAFGLQPLYFKDSRLCFPSWSRPKLITQATRQTILAALPFNQWLTNAIRKVITNKEIASQTKIWEIESILKILFYPTYYKSIIKVLN
tara:strand:+ start:274 stop:630 length:357 start_codon:yes stop_codon:yes gene_type:complete